MQINPDELSPMYQHYRKAHTQLDSGYKYQYDKYNDAYRWAPLEQISCTCARTDDDRDPWSTAGYNRGNIKNVIKLGFNPNKAERDELYKCN